jgi:hypothetical protein
MRRAAKGQRGAIGQRHRGGVAPVAPPAALARTHEGQRPPVAAHGGMESRTSLPSGARRSVSRRAWGRRRSVMGSVRPSRSIMGAGRRGGAASPASLVLFDDVERLHPFGPDDVMGSGPASVSLMALPTTLAPAWRTASRSPLIR